MQRFWSGQEFVVQGVAEGQCVGNKWASVTRVEQNEIQGVGRGQLLLSLIEHVKYFEFYSNGNERSD